MAIEKKSCDNCKFFGKNEQQYPCRKCRFTLPVTHSEYKKRQVRWEAKNNPVNHPSHYNKGKMEVADFIWDQKLNFNRGNAVKYVCRAGSKDPEKEIQDLEKAIWYINHEIKMLKGENEVGTEKES